MPSVALTPANVFPACARAVHGVPLLKVVRPETSTPDAGAGVAAAVAVVAVAAGMASPAMIISAPPAMLVSPLCLITRGSLPMLMVRMWS